ncbi:MAG: LPS export ABC transporter periplasmic protein LptC [Muribaculaceae bacterium]|nr:LPS export ABC transporter periplasmic protein LptC [Muribaculaceae bacterium]
MARGAMCLLPALVAVASIAATLGSCSRENRSYVAPISDPAATPTMSTTDVETFISDSGYTRYHISTPLWLMYDEAEEPFWRFPSGLFLEQYDENMQPAADIVCDSAVYFSRKRLWRLDGHVVMVNTLRDSFLTTQLYWDQYNQNVYSDSFIHIVRQDRIIEGYGFKSNQNMTAYTVHRPTGIIPVERPEAGSKPDTVAADTAPVKAGRRPAPRSASQRALDGGDIRAVTPIRQIKPANR